MSESNVLRFKPKPAPKVKKKDQEVLITLTIGDDGNLSHVLLDVGGYDGDPASISSPIHDAAWMVADHSRDAGGAESPSDLLLSIRVYRSGRMRVGSRAEEWQQEEHKAWLRKLLLEAVDIAGR